VGIAAEGLMTIMGPSRLKIIWIRELPRIAVGGADHEVQGVARRYPNPRIVEILSYRAAKSLYRRFEPAVP
jgi:hypothetical protein